MSFQLFRRGEAARNSINADTLAAINRSQAIIEFEPDGTIITANDNFLSVMGYDLLDVQGQHHSIFVDMDYAASTDYRAFWGKLAAGEYHRGSGVWAKAAKKFGSKHPITR